MACLCLEHQRVCVGAADQRLSAGAGGRACSIATSAGSSFVGIAARIAARDVPRHRAAIRRE